MAEDRVFISTCWENLFPNVAVKILPRLGTYHTPLVFYTGALTVPTIKQFGFENW